MNNRAQAGLEYLMTYGWALVLIVTVASVLFFVFSPGTSQVSFSSSNPTKILVRAGTIENGIAKIQLQNATGGKIIITSLGGGCTMTGATIPAAVGGGGIINMECPSSSGQIDPVSMEYSDFSGTQRSINISGRGKGSADPALVAYYKLDEIVAGKTPDASGKGHNGTVLNNPTQMTTGCVNGGCISFASASTQNIDCGSNVINATGAYTKLAWVKRAAGNYYNNIISSGDAADFSHVFWAPSGSSFFLSAGNRTTANVADTAAIAINVWNQVAVTFDPAVSFGTMKLYKNGAQVGNTATGVLTPSGTPKTYIGGYCAGYTFNGLIDEVMVYNRALTAAEICSNCKLYSPAAGITCSTGCS